MLGSPVDSEGKLDLLHLGGEPTLHPQILDIIRARPAHPPRDAEHQRHPHRPGSEFVAALPR
jgi:hypothetical protein